MHKGHTPYDKAVQGILSPVTTHFSNQLWKREMIIFQKRKICLIWSEQTWVGHVYMVLHIFFAFLLSGKVFFQTLVNETLLVFWQ